MVNLLKLTKKCIKHWKRIKKGKDLEYGGENCAYCKEFIENSCMECPIYWETGETGCADGPWQRFHNHIKASHDKEEVEELCLKPKTVENCQDCQDLADQMIDMLVKIKGEIENDQDG